MSKTTQRKANLLRHREKDPYKQAYDWLTARSAIIIIAAVILSWALIIWFTLSLMTLATIGAGY
jgi:lipopolysaccharide/colanic/teichoic acid biosynthesis glycosyltransferase